MVTDQLRTSKSDLPEFYKVGVNPTGSFIEIACKGGFILPEQDFERFRIVDVTVDLFFHVSYLPGALSALVPCSERSLGGSAFFIICSGDPHAGDNRAGC